MSLQLLLLSLVRTQAAMTLNDKDGTLLEAFDILRRQWSLILQAQLMHT